MQSYRDVKRADTVGPVKAIHSVSHTTTKRRSPPLKSPDKRLSRPNSRGTSPDAKSDKWKIGHDRKSPVGARTSPVTTASPVRKSPSFRTSPVITSTPPHKLVDPPLRHRSPKTRHTTTTGTVKGKSAAKSSKTVDNEKDDHMLMFDCEYDDLHMDETAPADLPAGSLEDDEVMNNIIKYFQEEERALKERQEAQREVMIKKWLERIRTMFVHKGVSPAAAKLPSEMHLRMLIDKYKSWQSAPEPGPRTAGYDPRNTPPTHDCNPTSSALDMEDELELNGCVVTKGKGLYQDTVHSSDDSDVDDERPNFDKIIADHSSFPSYCLGFSPMRMYDNNSGAAHMSDMFAHLSLTAGRDRNAVASDTHRTHFEDAEPQVPERGPCGRPRFASDALPTLSPPMPKSPKVDTRPGAPLPKETPSPAEEPIAVASDSTSGNPTGYVVPIPSNSSSLTAQTILSRRGELSEGVVTLPNSLENSGLLAPEFAVGSPAQNNTFNLTTVPPKSHSTAPRPERGSGSIGKALKLDLTRIKATTDTYSPDPSKSCHSICSPRSAFSAPLSQRSTESSHTSPSPSPAPSPRVAPSTEPLWFHRR